MSDTEAKTTEQEQQEKTELEQQEEVVEQSQEESEQNNETKTEAEQDANPNSAPAEEKINEEELEEMKQRVKEMEAEAAKIMEMNEEATKIDTTENTEAKDVDSRSVYVGNVDYTSTPEELQTLFQSCGTINRITIIHDRFTGHPKGYAYIEFADVQSVQSALIFNELQFKGRPIKVLAKRTNLPGMSKRGRGAYRGGFRGYRGSFFGRGRGAYRGAFYSPY
jgi:polyadenylate-binding protein 2